jgi:hypothetical protein
VIVRVRRISAICLVLSATAILLAACGNSSHTSASDAALIAGPPITNAQALAYAHAVNLRPGDVPGTTSKRTAESVETVSHEGRNPSAFLRCAGLPTPRMVPRIRSAILGAPYWWMRSTVEVMPSEAFATAYAALLGSSRDRRCLFPRQAESKMAYTPLPVASPIVGLRVTQSTGTIGQTYQDLFTFASGRAVITLNISGSILRTAGSKMPSLTVEQRLASLLYSRAEAHKL